MIQIYSGTTRGRVLNGELYAQRLQKLIYLYLFIYRLFYEDFSPIIGTNFRSINLHPIAINLSFKLLNNRL